MGILAVQDITDAITFVSIFSFIVGALITIFWMVVGWRAMIAHEHLAGAAQTAVTELKKHKRAGATKP